VSLRSAADKYLPSPQPSPSGLGEGIFDSKNLLSYPRLHAGEGTMSARIRSGLYFKEAVMDRFVKLVLSAALVAAVSACGEKKESVDVQKVMQEGMQKEKSMMEGAQKNVEGMEKKAAEAKEEAKK